MRENIGFQKSFKFAIRIIKLTNFLQETKKEFTLSKQILRSGTSIGANLSEAECAISKNDFLAKVYIAYKECSETIYWLQLLRATKYLDEKMYASLYNDCQEIVKILAATTKTTEKNIKSEKTKK